MLDNFWIAKCVQVFDSENTVKIAFCTECKCCTYIFPEEYKNVSESSKAELFRAIKHSDTCNAYRLYLKDSTKSKTGEKGMALKKLWRLFLLALFLANGIVLIAFDSTKNGFFMVLTYIVLLEERMTR